MLMHLGNFWYMAACSSNCHGQQAGCSDLEISQLPAPHLPLTAGCLLNPEALLNPAFTEGMKDR